MSLMATSTAWVPTMLRSRVVWLLASAAVVLAGPGCSSTDPSKPSPSARVMISGLTDTLTVGESVQLTATKADGTRILAQDVTWQSANPAIATVSALGAVTAVEVGTVEIRATSNGATGSAQMVVPSVTSVAISGMRSPMALGDKQQLQATAFLSNNLNKDVTNRATWSLSSAGVFSVSPAGLLTAIGKGSTHVQAAFGGVSNSASGVVDQTVVDQTCTYTLSPYFTPLPRQAPIVHAVVKIDTQPGCPWTATPDASWLQLLSFDASGTGPRSVGVFTSYLDAPWDDGATSRVGHVQIRWGTPTTGWDVEVIQTSQCESALAPHTPMSFGPDGGTGYLEVLAPFFTSRFTIDTQADWITNQYLGRELEGDNWDIHFTVAPNPSSTPRTGTFRSCGKELNVTQAGR